MPAEDQVADVAADADLLCLLFGASVAAEAGQAWMAEEYWGTNGVMMTAESSGTAQCSPLNQGNVATMAVAEGWTLSREKRMRNYFAYTFGLAPPTASLKGMHRDWARMAVGVELEAYRQHGAVLTGMCLVAGEVAHGDTNLSWLRPAVVGPVVD